MTSAIEKTDRSSEPSLLEGRLCILLAAVLWSTSSVFVKMLTRDTWFALNEPTIEPLQMAFYRVLFAGMILMTMIRRNEMVITQPMIWMAVVFALMNCFFISSMALGTAAKAILLQYTAPIWMYLACIFLLGEKTDRRSSVSVVIGLIGVGVIIAGGGQGETFFVVLLGLASGLTYAGVLIFLRVLRGFSARWLTAWNMLTAACILAPFGILAGLPSWPQLLAFLFFGVFQLGLPYFLMAHGLRVVSPQEAGAIALLEPLLNPLWAYLISPETERLSYFDFAGGALILGGLAWRYWPRSSSTVPSTSISDSK